MGFLSESTTSAYGAINYIDGKPTTIKFNQKDGVFQQLSSDFGSDTMTVSIVKEVSLPELVLYPFDEANARAIEHTVLFFIDHETNDLCVGLVKTYSEGTLRQLKTEIAAYNRNNNTSFDISDFEITMSWEKGLNGSKYFAINFTFCKDAKGEPCNYLTPNRKTGALEMNEDATAQQLDKEVYERNYELHQKTDGGNLIFDYRLGKEIVKSNFDEATKSKLNGKTTEFTIYVLSRYGFFDNATMQTLINAKKSIVTDLQKALQPVNE